MKKIIFIVFILFTTAIVAQVGIGTQTPHHSAILEIASTTKGFLLPRMTQNQIARIAAPAEGLLLYCTDCTPKGVYLYDGTNFKDLASNTLLSTTTVPTLIGAGGATWMDRNLGASQVATSITDATAYGHLYQWGRGADGHQEFTGTCGPNGSAPCTSVTATSSTPGHGAFIVVNLATSPEFDWLTPQNNTLWQGVNGTNNPCPTGFRIPTANEWQEEIDAWDVNDINTAAFNSLKLTLAGARSGSGQKGLQGIVGRYWSSTTQNSTNARMLQFYGSAFGQSNIKEITGNNRAEAYPIRCIKNE
jgi:uncharacterized protein (TIGR02145 family)